MVLENSLILSTNFSGNESNIKPTLCWESSIIVFCIVSFRISKLAWLLLSIVSAAILKTEIAPSKPSWDWALASEIPASWPSFKPSCFPFSKAICSASLIFCSIKALFSSINCCLFNSLKLSSFVPLTSFSLGNFFSDSRFWSDWILSSSSFSSLLTSSSPEILLSEEFFELDDSRAISSNDLFLNEEFSGELFVSFGLKEAFFTEFKILVISAFLKTWGS